MPSFINFKCRCCGCVEYAPVKVRRAGKVIRTEFFFCLGCSAMFLEPELFSDIALPPLNDVPGTMAHQVGEVALKGRLRFVRARAKHRGGGISEISDREIAALLRDYF